MDHRLDGITSPGDPSVSPDGSRVAFTVTTIDTGEDAYRSQIWLAEAGDARRFTSGKSDFGARWSPDGTRIAFLRREDGPPQVAVIAVDGGEAQVVTDFPLGVAEPPVWSPDGTRLVVVGKVWREEWADLDDEERSRRPRRIDRRYYRADGQGWVHDRRRHLFIVDPEGVEEPRRLTEGEHDEAGPAWSPDGDHIAYLTDTSARIGYEPGAEVHEVSAEGGEGRPVAPRGMWNAVGYRPDGVLHALGYPGDDFPDLAVLWRLEDGVAEKVAEADRSMVPVGPPAMGFEFEGDRAVVPWMDSGSVGLRAVSPDGQIETLVEGRSIVTGFDTSGSTLVYTVSTIESPGELVMRTGDGEHRLSEFGGVVPEVTQPEHFTVDGLDVWVYLPDGDEEVPLLLNIHGGPAGQYGWGFFDEFQVYVSAGYGVVATNPRGSGGGDRDFLRAVRGSGWGEVDVEDIDRVVAAALERFPRLSRERLGVMGGSYGGFLTAWLTAHQDRWRTAIVERALLSWPSFAGTSDIGGWFGDAYLGERELVWDRSPLRLADRVSTPTLIIHSEEDHRCPIEQAEQYFDALLRNGVNAEFVRFPGEGHELSRSGKPKHREERFEIILDWLKRTL